MYETRLFADGKSFFEWAQKNAPKSTRANDMVGWKGAINYIHLDQDLVLLYQLEETGKSWTVCGLHMLLWGVQDTLRKDVCKISKFYRPADSVLWHASVIYGGRAPLDFCVTNAFQAEEYEKYSNGGNFTMTFAGLGDYLECMKMRYGDDLKYEIDIPEEMMNIKIPKLCLQLIAENSIKFATKSVKPPWRIKISGKITGIYWEISVRDNGAGFSEDDIKEINEKTEYINETEMLPDLEINGMGLMNIYIRFKTLYRGKHIFKISNATDGGAIVTIGGEHAESAIDAAESVKNG